MASISARMFRRRMSSLSFITKLPLSIIDVHDVFKYRHVIRMLPGNTGMRCIFQPWSMARYDRLWFFARSACSSLPGTCAAERCHRITRRSQRSSFQDAGSRRFSASITETHPAVREDFGPVDSRCFSSSKDVGFLNVITSTLFMILSSASVHPFACGHAVRIEHDLQVRASFLWFSALMLR